MKNLYVRYQGGDEEKEEEEANQLRVKSNHRPIEYHLTTKVSSNKRSRMLYLGKALILLMAIQAATAAATAHPSNKVTLAEAGSRNATLKRDHQRAPNSIGPMISKLNSTTTAAARSAPSNKFNSTLARELSPRLVKIVIKHSNQTIEQLVGRQNKSSTSMASTGFGGQAAPSLFKPSFLRGLLGREKTVSADESGDDQEQEDGQKSSGKGEKGDEEEEEEVTKTIEVPMKADGETADGEKQSASNDEGSSASAGDDEHGADEASEIRGDKNLLPKRKRQRKGGEVRPKTAASLQLTSTEMNSILNDQEGPEYLRMRELIGDGVLVNEEPRLAASASNGFRPTGYMNGGGGGDGGFDGGDAAALAMGHRLLHSASNDGSGMGGLLHRFGSFDGGLANAAEMGRLAQSPNEYSGMQANVGGGGGFGPMADYSGGGGGLIRAGSGDSMGSYGAAGLGSFGGAGSMSGFGGAGGYPNSPMLDGHSSELYGGSYGGSSGAGFGANSQDFLYNRLAAAASQGLPAGGLPRESFEGEFVGANVAAGNGANEDEYTSRYGHPFDQRGFASQNRAMLRDNSMVSHNGFAGSAMKAVSHSSGASGAPLVANPSLVPLSPIVPMADEVGSGQASQLHETNFGARQPMVEQPMEGSSSLAQEDDASGQRSSAENEGEANSYDAGSSQTSYTEQNQPSGQSDHQEAYKSRRDLLADNDQTGRAETNEEQQQQQQLLQQQEHRSSSGPIIEFARIGGAGYLAPRLLPLSGQQMDSLSSALRQTQQLSKKIGGLEQVGQRNSDNYDPTHNPSHAGKFIIE